MTNMTASAATSAVMHKPRIHPCANEYTGRLNMKKPKSMPNTGSVALNCAALVNLRNSSQLPESTDPKMTLRTTVAATAATATIRVRDAAASGGMGRRAGPALLA